MNRLTIRIDVSDDVEIKVSDLACLKVDIETVLAGLVQQKDLIGFDVLQETKKRFHY